MGLPETEAPVGLESARARGRELLALALAAATRGSRRQLMEKAFAWAQLAAVLEEEALAPPPAPATWRRNPPQRRRDAC